MNRFKLGLAAIGIVCAGLVLVYTAQFGTALNPNEPATDRLTVAAASDLYYAFRDVQDAFERERSVSIEFNFGSSGMLAQQIHEGAPVDVYASANRDYVQELIKHDRMESTNTYVYARGYLVLLGKQPLSIDQLAALNPEPGTRLAIANPDHAPYGMAARQALQSVDLWDPWTDQFVIAESIQHSYELLNRGDVDYALTALSLVKGDPERRWFRITGKLHQPIDQEIGIPTTSTHPKIAREFISFLRKKKGRSILSQYGFTFPDRSH